MQKSSYSGKSTDIREIIDYAKMKQVVIASDALQEIDDTNFKEIIDKANTNGEFMISKDFVMEFKRSEENVIPNEEKAEYVAVPEIQVEIKKSHNIYARDIDSDIKVLHETDITNRGNIEGKVGEFLQYFNERYEELGNILKKRPNITPVDSRYLDKRTKKNEDVVLVGMLSAKGVTKNGNIMVTFDDLEGSFKVVVMQKDEDLFNLAKNLVNDDVVAIKGSKLGDDIIIAKEIEFPDLPNRTFKKSSRDVSAAVISDMHIGSSLFYEDEFQKFCDWLNMKNLDEKERETVGKIKYLFIAGDVVDGIGVYPQQFNELSIYNIYEQFDKFTSFIEQIPDYIEVIIGPGNHDSIRLADPQPAINSEYTKSLQKLKNIHFVGSPTWIEVEGLKTLMYHGNSMFSIQQAMNLDATKPEKTMIEMLKRRDLAPIYGSRHPILPEKGGYLLMKEEPDIFITGHIHHNGYENYKGCLVVNPGCWQGQTVYQMDQGHIPTPGRVPIIELKTGKIKEKVFIDELTKI